LIEEEKTLPLQKDKKVEVVNDVDEPVIAENIIPDKIFDEARSSIVVPPDRSEFIGQNNQSTSNTTGFAPATGSQQTSAQTIAMRDPSHNSPSRVEDQDSPTLKPQSIIQQSKDSRLGSFLQPISQLASAMGYKFQEDVTRKEL
jgi:hypothetical protein